MTFVGCAGAQATTGVVEEASGPQNVCQRDPAFEQFDFWLGDWSVYDLDGALQGTNRITKQEAGCLVLEQWRSVKGTTGQSYNFYDPVRQKWRQVWVSRGMSIDYEGGLRDDGTMELVGEIHYHSGRSARFRGEWSQQTDGSVRQHFEEYDAETETWKPWFTGIYRRQ